MKKKPKKHGFPLTYCTIYSTIKVDKGGENMLDTIEQIARILASLATTIGILVALKKSDSNDKKD